MNGFRTFRPAAAVPIVAMLVAALLVGPACRPKNAELGAPVALEMGQGAYFKDSDLRLRFRRVVGDSRCPRGATCVRAGEAVILVEGRLRAGYPPERFEVVKPEAAPPTPTLFDGYRIELQSLEPYPVTGRAADTTAYVATLMVQMR